MPQTAPTKELIKLVDDTYFDLLGKTVNTFLQSIIKREVVINPSKQIDIGLDNVEIIGYNILEFEAFFSFIYKAYIKHYFSSFFDISFLRTKYDPLNDYKEEKSFPSQSDKIIIESRTQVYDSLWNSSGKMNTKKELICRAFSAFCSYILQNKEFGENQIIDDQEYKDNNYYFLCCSLAQAYMKVCDETAPFMLKYYWKRNNLCQYCGNAFAGFLTKKCSICKRKKDY